MAEQMRRASRHDLVLDLQRVILEAFAAGEPTSAVLETLCLEIERSLGGGKRCTVLFIEDGKLRHGAAPSMPAGFIAAVDGLAIGPRVGSCGTAAYRGDKVIVADVHTSDLWADHSELTGNYDLGSCWSIPVFSRQRGNPAHQVIATFAVYGDVGEHPTAEEIELLDELTAVVGLYLSGALARDRYEQERARIERVIAATNLGMWDWNPATGDVWVSDEVKRLLGFDEVSNSITFDDFASVVHPEDLPVVMEHIEEHVAGRTDMFVFEFRVRRSCGQWRWLLDRGQAVAYDTRGNPTRIMGSVQDITESKRAEEELLRMQKLEGLGRIAGGVAHDFNNILVGIYGGIALAKEQLADDEPALFDLELAEESLEHARALTRQLLTFSRGGAPVPEVLDLHELVERVVRFDLSGSNAKPIFDIPDDLWRATVDPAQAQQVFSNLALNAREAMTRSGKLWVSLENVEVAADGPVKPGLYVRATIRDEAGGMAPEVVEQIFDPYFTTKENGSGLGLATVYSIVTRHGGSIDVESHEGEGTTFRLLLPATKLESAVANPPKQPVDAGPRRVLVMDDQDDVLRICSRMLEQLGHAVEVARSGDEVLEMVEASATFDVVLLDLTVPGESGGLEIVSQLRESLPNVRVVASTGYTEDADVTALEDRGFDAVLPKPYTLEELQYAVGGS
jgi:PAS domain S-box-containing protein